MADPWATFADAPGPQRKPAQVDPWAAFNDAPKANAPSTLTGRVAIAAGTRPHDGDTMPLGGRNGRLYGVDAFELGQSGFTPSGPVPLGMDARKVLSDQIARGATANMTGTQTYGRPVVTLDTPGGDAGKAMVASGYALPEPKYLSADQRRLNDYIAAQNGAIAKERGAYAGQYQRPSDFRHMGAASAPFVGKVPLSDEQKAGYVGVLTDPNATPDKLDSWYKSQGYPAANVSNVFQYQRRFGTLAPNYFQQSNALGQPVAPDPVPLGTRLIGSGNEGVASLLGFPGDVVNSVERIAGLNVPQDAWGTSASLKRGFSKMGWNGAPGDANWAPKSTAERYGQSIMNATGQAVVPFAATLGIGSRLAAGTQAIENGGNVVANVVRNMGKDAFANTGKALAGEAAGAVGSGVGGQLARDVFPDNPYADFVGQLAGGIGAGVGAGRLAGKIKGAGPEGSSLEGSGARLPEEAPPIIKDGKAIEPTTGITAPAVKPDGSPFYAWGRDADTGKPYPMYGSPPGAEAPLVSDGGVTPGGTSGPGSRIDAIASPKLGAADQAMASDLPPVESVSAPVDQWDSFADHPSSVDPFAGFADHRPARMDAAATPEQIAATARSIRPEDVQALPSNVVESVDEAARIGVGQRPEIQAPDERSMLPSYTLPGQSRPRRNPLDLAGFLRTQGGVADMGGDLRQLGIDNKPRPIDFARDEGFLGPLVNPNGRSVEDASRSAWDAGYFPNHVQPPSPNEFIDALHATHRGDPGRVFHPDDYAAVENYYKATDDRHMIEQAKQEGSPLVMDNGQPVSLADLDANQPPATAYEDLPKASGRVGNINLDRIENADQIGRMIRTIDNRFGGFDAARRGVVTHAETAALADEMGMTVNDLLKRQRGQALNAEQALKARQIHQQGAMELDRLASKAIGGTDEDLAKFHRALVTQAAIQEQIAGISAEAGRTLSSLRIPAGSANMGRIHKDMLQGAGGREHLEDVARRLTELKADGATPGAVAKFARDAIKPKFSDKLVELYYNSLLSNPKTHVVNTVSNALTALAQIPEHAGAAAIGAVRHHVFRGSADRITTAEVATRAIAMMQGAREGVDAAARTFRTGNVIDPLTKVEARNHHAIGGRLGAVLRAPTRFLEGSDEFFKAIGRRMELDGLATRQANAEGLKGDAFNQRKADLSSNPTDAMLEKSLDYARYITFQRPLGKAGNALSNLTLAAPALKLVIPFIRTPTNMLKYAVERSPLAPVSSHWRADMLAGGSRRDLAMIKVVMGSGLGMLVAQYVADGRITGSMPTDKKQAGLLKADGWQPYSLRIGDKYYSYARMDPFATTISTAADIATQMHNGETDPDKAAASMASAFVDQLDNKTFMSGISDLMKAFDPRGNGSIIDRAKTYGGRQVSGFVPAIVGEVARQVDPTVRDQKGFLAPIQAKIPIWSRGLPAKQNAWGMDVARQGSLGPDAISPFGLSKRANDPVNARLLQLGMGMSPPSKLIDGHPITDQQFRDYNRASGTLIYKSLLPVVGNPQWLAQSPEDQAKQIQTLKNEARKQVRAGLFGAKH
jgi:endonuclease YncB( thermonuclease family)